MSLLPQTSMWLAHQHSLCECACKKRCPATLGKMASPFKTINVWNVSSLIFFFTFKQVRSSDFCMVVMHNKVLTQYQNFCLWTLLSPFPFQNGTLQLARFDSAHLLSVINAPLATLNLLSIIHHQDSPCEET